MSEATPVSPLSIDEDSLIDAIGRLEAALGELRITRYSGDPKNIKPSPEKSNILHALLLLLRTALWANSANPRFPKGAEITALRLAMKPEKGEISAFVSKPHEFPVQSKIVEQARNYVIGLVAGL